MLKSVSVCKPKDNGPVLFKIYSTSTLKVKIRVEGCR